MQFVPPETWLMNILDTPRMWVLQSIQTLGDQVPSFMTMKLAKLMHFAGRILHFFQSFRLEMMATG